MQGQLAQGIRHQPSGDPHQGAGAAHLEQAEQGGGGAGAVAEGGQRHAGGSAQYHSVVAEGLEVALVEERQAEMFLVLQVVIKHLDMHSEEEKVLVLILMVLVVAVVGLEGFQRLITGLVEVLDIFCLPVSELYS